jgi:hypothetical protein
MAASLCGQRQIGDACDVLDATDLGLRLIPARR